MFGQMTGNGKAFAGRQKYVDILLSTMLNCLIVNLMQMYMQMFVIEVLQKSKYPYPAPFWHTSGAALGI